MRSLQNHGLAICYASIAVSVSLSGSARADIDPASGIDFVTIGALGNAPWLGDGTAGDRAVGRGRVDYQYNIGRLEVTTAQWVEFFNAAYDRPANDRIPHLAVPDFWGAVGATPNMPGGRRWSVPTGNENRFVGNISWRMAAIYCNWLCNGKSTARSAFLNGAYDVSTFGWTGDLGDIFTDQFAHNPGATYWIPTWDEWLKAAHYDPAKQNSDGSMGGYWAYSNSSNTAATSGPPGLGQANYGWESNNFPGHDPLGVLLGAYPQTQSPWGLFDTAGGTTEWTESVLETIPSDGRRYRYLEGSHWGRSGNSLSDLVVNGGTAEFPQVATFADHHMQMTKSAADGRIVTEVKTLSKSARQEELLRMLGGTPELFLPSQLPSSKEEGL